jgi:hypothetical protein
MGASLSTDRMTRRVAFTLALAMFAGIGPAAAQSWKEYSFPNDSFAVSFPMPPKIEKTSYQTADGRSVDARVYSVARGNAVFKMMVVDLSSSETDEAAVIDHAITRLSQVGEITVNIPARVARVLGRQLSIEKADGGRSSIGLFYHQRRLYQIEGTALPTGEDATGEAIRFAQSLIFTDKTNASWSQLVEHFHSECLRQFQNLRGPGQAAKVREHVRSCVQAKVQAEAGKIAPEP